MTSDRGGPDPHRARDVARLLAPRIEQDVPGHATSLPASDAAALGWVPATASSPGRGFKASRALALLGLQQAIGNQAVQRLIQRQAEGDAPAEQTGETGEISETGAAGGDALPTAADGTDDPKRMEIVATATLEATGAVHAKSVGDSDETGRTTRPGWQQLLKYFHDAAPGLWSDDVIKYNSQPGMNGLPHWCGIFALWALRSSGMGVGTWKMGSGISAVSGIKPVSKQTVKVGDIGYLESAQHHFIVAGISADRKTIQTVDGNSGSDSEVTAGNTKQVANVAGFFTAF
jgi:hypothetical protein